MEGEWRECIGVECSQAMRPQMPPDAPPKHTHTHDMTNLLLAYSLVVLPLELKVIVLQGGLERGETVPQA